MTPLADLLADSSRVVAFTGAGISTESGIPDFRSAGGIWTRYDPADLTFSRYVDSARVRELSWQMRRELLAQGYAPNPGHLALARLEQSGRGSSLAVYPAADLPVVAVRNGALLAIVNDEPTPYDGLAELVVRGRAAEVLAEAVDAVS